MYKISYTLKWPATVYKIIHTKVYEIPYILYCLLMYICSTVRFTIHAGEPGRPCWRAGATMLDRSLQCFRHRRFFPFSVFDIVGFFPSVFSTSQNFSDWRGA